VNLKRIAALALCLTLVFSVTGTALADDTADNGGAQAPAVSTDYMEQMVQAAMCGNTAAGTAAQDARNAKIDALGLDYPKVSYEDLYLLAKVMTWEAGSNWLPDTWKLCVGEVVLNRVASPEFPDTIYDVVYQKGQYSGSGGSRFARTQPDERDVRLALRLLEGERYMNNPAVVFQAQFRQGSGVFLAFHDYRSGTEYFCLSAHPELYYT